MDSLRACTLCLSVLMLGLPCIAEAQYLVCNKSKNDKIYVAIAYNENNRWVSRGWFQVAKNDCATLLEGNLIERYYYLFAFAAEAGGRTQRWEGTTDEHRFCVVRPEPFTIYTRDCATRKYESESFFQVDTRNNTKWTTDFISDPEIAPAPAGEKYRVQVEQAMSAAARPLTREGYEPSHALMTGTLGKGATRELTINLAAGKRYRILGTCDDDCSDLDLRAYNGAAVEVDSDTDLDAAPLLTVVPPTAGIYTVRVVMADCASTSCYYGVRVFALSK